MAKRTEFLITLEGLLVRDPRSMNPLQSKGETKPLSGPEGRYWRRRIKDGSVKIGKIPSAPKAVSNRERK
jgi:hypothetical protein